MKKIAIVLAFVALSLGLKAECPPEVEDFTFTDCYGVEYNLFELLDNGQYVLMELRDYTNGNVSGISSLYHRYGCNGRGIFLLELFPQKNDSVAQAWIDNYIVEFPVVTGDGGGDEFFEQYQDCFGSSWYGLMLIHPDHTIHEHIMYLDDLDSIFWTSGIIPDDCNFGFCSAPRNLTVESIDSNRYQLSWEGDEEVLYYHLYYNTQYNSQFIMNVYDTVCEVSSGACYSVVSHCADGSECGSDTVCIAPRAIDFLATDCHGNEIHLFDILDSGKYVMIDYFWYTCSGCREIMPNIVETYHRYGCNEEDIYYIEVDQYDDNERCLLWCDEFGVKFPTISKDGGGEEIAMLYHLSFAPHYFLIAPDHTIVWNCNSGYPFEYAFDFFDLQSVINAYEAIGIEEHLCYEGMNENDGQNLSLFPNPADDFVTLTVESSSLVRIYNALSQLMDSFVSDNQQVRIETSRYPEGLYFIQVDGKNYGRFVVSH